MRRVVLGKDMDVGQLNTSAVEVRMSVRGCGRERMCMREWVVGGCMVRACVGLGF